MSRSINSRAPTDNKSDSTVLVDTSSSSDDGSTEVIEADSRFWWVIAGLSGMTAVIAASHAAHGLAKTSSDVYYIDIFKTAAGFQLSHSLAIAAAPLIVGTMRRQRHRTGQGVVSSLFSNLGLTRTPAVRSNAGKMKPYRNLAAASLLVGNICFSGSLYAITFTEDRKWGKIAPIGGVAYIGGWLLLALGL